MLKIEKDILNETNPTILKIGNELIRRSVIDKTLHDTFNKPHKSLKQMFSYVLSEARKIAVEGATAIDDDNVVYGWAQHYYDEDSIMPLKKETKSIKESSPTIELAEETMDDFDI